MRRYIEAGNGTSQNYSDEVGRCRLTLSKPTLKAIMVAAIQRLKPQYDETLSKFAFKISLRLYNECRECPDKALCIGGAKSPECLPGTYSIGSGQGLTIGFPFFSSTSAMLWPR